MNTLKLAALACSGLGAFLAAAQWSRPVAAEGDELVVVASAAERAALHAGAASAPRAATDTRLPAAAGLDLPRRARSIPSTAHTDAFEPLNWQPPKPPPAPLVQAAPPPAPPPPPPTAPKLPFTFMGILDRGNLPPQAYVAKGDTLLIVAAGDQIDNGSYRVESVDGNAVVFTYLPLGTKQTLAAPGVNP